METAQRGALVLDSSTHCDLPDSAEAPRVARRFVAARCREWGYPPDDMAPTLLTSEVVTNALRHSFAPRGLTVSRSQPGAMLVEVSDSSAAPPVFRDSRDMGAESGRGLWLLERLAARWGHEQTPAGKVVWFLLDRDGPVSG